jgi:hypothetical protein
MSTPNKKSLADRLRHKRLAWLKAHMRMKTKEMKLKAEYQKNSHSLLWVWEFSKKAVLICFIFYVIVQIYSMAVMVIYCDFTHLGDLITKTGEIVENCVFAYLIKSGIENLPKIIFGHKTDDTNDPDDAVG